MNPKCEQTLDKMISNETPLKPEEKQILLEALEAAAEIANEAKSTRH